MSDPTQTTRRVPQTEEQIRAVRIGEPVRLTGKIRIVDYDLAWPRQFASEAGKIQAALGAGALQVEHAGSTSVPGLAAKPIIDIVLVVADSADEPSYVPALEAAGYVLRIREPEWFEHRVLKGADPDVNLHVFSAVAPRSSACSPSAIGCAPTTPTARCMSAPSVSWRNATGPTCSTMPTPRPRSSRPFLRAR